MPWWYSNIIYVNLDEHLGTICFIVNFEISNKQFIPVKRLLSIDDATSVWSCWSLSGSCRQECLWLVSSSSSRNACVYTFIGWDGCLIDRHHAITLESTHHCHLGLDSIHLRVVKDSNPYQISFHNIGTSCLQEWKPSKDQRSSVLIDIYQMPIMNPNWTTRRAKTTAVKKARVVRPTGPWVTKP